MKHRRGKALVGLTVVFVLLLAAVGAAQSEEIVLGSHSGLSGLFFPSGGAWYSPNV